MTHHDIKKTSQSKDIFFNTASPILRFIWLFFKITGFLNRPIGQKRNINVPFYYNRLAKLLKSILNKPVLLFSK